MNTNAIGKTGGDSSLITNTMPFLALNYYINAGGYASEILSPFSKRGID